MNISDRLNNLLFSIELLSLEKVDIKNFERPCLFYEKEKGYLYIYNLNIRLEIKCVYPDYDDWSGRGEVIARVDAISSNAEQVYPFPVFNTSFLCPMSEYEKTWVLLRKI